MVQVNAPLYTFNQGEIGKRALGRLDLERYRVAAELFDNYFPSVLGPMGLRPGLGFLNVYTDGNNAARFIPFIFNTTTAALIVLTNNKLKFLVDDSYVSRPAVSTTITNGDFSTNTGWTVERFRDVDEITRTFYNTSINQFEIKSVKNSYASLSQALTIAAPDQGVVHGLNIKIEDGSVILSIGTTNGDDDVRKATVLDPGIHKLAFTPNASTVYLHMRSVNQGRTTIQECNIEQNVDVEITSIWPEADLSYLQYDQSADVIFVACKPPGTIGYPQRKIERRSQTEWSLTQYRTLSGPWVTQSEDPGRTITVSQVNISDPNLPEQEYDLNVSDDNMIEDLQNGDLIEVTWFKQITKDYLTASGQETPPIRIVGRGDTSTDRRHDQVIAFTGITSPILQRERAVGAPVNYASVGDITADVSNTLTDDYDGVEVFRRYVMGSGTFNAVNGSVVVTHSRDSQEQAVIFRVIWKPNSSTLRCSVVGDYHPPINEQTTRYRLQTWSDEYFYPSSVSLHDGRLFWGGQDKIWGSESDAFTLFDLNSESGDAKSIDRRIDSRYVEGLISLLSLQRLLGFTGGFEASIRSSSFDEPLTNEKFLVRRTSSRGSNFVKPLEIDGRAIFMHRDNIRSYELTFDIEKNDYGTNDITRLHPEVCIPGVIDMDVQRSPETRVYLILSDGSIVVLTYERDERVIAWSRMTINGEAEAVVVLPGISNDNVYFIIKRTINSSVVRSIEKLAPEKATRGETDNHYTLDSYIEIDLGSPGTAVSGLSHLEGETVKTWVDGQYGGEYTVSSGAITLDEAGTKVVVGYGYVAKWKSTKLAYAHQKGTALLQKKRVNQLGLLMCDTVREGTKVGQDFGSSLQPIRKTYKGNTTLNNVIEDKDDVTQPINSNWDTDSRVCLQTESPYPATVLAMVIGLDVNEK